MNETNILVIDTEEGLSEYPHVILNQARLHDFFLDEMMKSGLAPTYSQQLSALQQDSSDDFMTVSLKRSESSNEGDNKQIKSRFVVGCDGARSTVRKSLDLKLHGDSAHAAWGVADILPDTDFPDVRFKCIIRSKDAGTLQIIPREGGYLIRIYVELDKLEIGERVAQRNLTFEDLMQTAKRIFKPYKFEAKECAWWSVYEIGQRLTDRFDNATPTTTPTAFICGDACHTHSPKAGQGMNVSMQDGLNLGWKLAQVVRGTADASILRTYDAERQSCARDLIDFDHELAQVFSGKNDVDAKTFEDYFRKSGNYMAGVAIQYQPSIITLSIDNCKPELAGGYPIGKRFHSELVLRCADARKVHLGHAMPADGRFRILVFGGDIGSEAYKSAISLCEWLGADTESPLRKFTPPANDVDSVIDVKAIFRGSHADIELDKLPSVLWPQKGRYGLRDYEKVFVDRWTTGKFSMPSIYETRAISREFGCVVVVRPDQHVSAVLGLDDEGQLTSFFAGFMRPQT